MHRVGNYRNANLSVQIISKRTEVTNALRKETNALIYFV